MRPKDVVTSAFLDHALKYLFQSGYWRGVCKQSVNQASVNQQDISRVEIRYPTLLAEQQRIVGILDEAFEGIATAKANAEKNLKNARALFESHLQSVFTERGEGWVEHTLGDLIDIQNGYAFKSTDYTDDGYFVIRISNVQDGEITLSNPRFIKLTDNKLRRFILNGGDILISLTGNIGRVGIIEEEHLPAVLNQRVARITVKGRNANRDFLFRFLSSRTFRESLQEAGHGAAQQNVSTKEIESVSISLPALKQQSRIVEEFDNFAAETHRLATIYERKLAALDDLKKSLLHQAFTGEL
jgi:type I restriction enzyme S subunit